MNVRCPNGMRAGQNLRIQLPNQTPTPDRQQAYMVTIPSGVRPGDQFRVLVNGNELMVTCPANARPGTNVRIFPPATVPPPTERQPDAVQTFEVVVPSGVQPGQPFALLANGQSVLVTCPMTAQAGQRIRFQLPVSGAGTGGDGQPTELTAVKLTYDKDGWSRAVSPVDKKFHWFMNKTVAEEVRRGGQASNDDTCDDGLHDRTMMRCLVVRRASLFCSRVPSPAHTVFAVQDRRHQVRLRGLRVGEEAGRN